MRLAYGGRGYLNVVPSDTLINTFLFYSFLFHGTLL